MPDVALSMDLVSKRFRKGELHDSLRDLFPALLKGVLRQPVRSRAEREFWALRDVSFEVNRGEAFGIIGHNGAGKSTMLKHLTGIMEPTSGKIRVNGKLSALIEVGAGFHPDLTGRENVFLNGVILGMKKEDIRKKFDEIVAFSGLEEFIDMPVKRYSSGMYARLGFSVAAYVEPEILVVDEVLSVGDMVFQRKSVEKMESVVRSGATVIFVSHNLRAVTDLCSRCILLDHGRIVKAGPTDEVVRQYIEQNAAGSSRRPQDVWISGVKLVGKNGEELQFESGAGARLEVEIAAAEPARHLALVLEFKDENFNMVFHTSTQRLGWPTVDLDAGGTHTFAFDLDLNFAFGTFRLGVTIYRYDKQKQYDYWFPAATIYVSTANDVRGAVNLNPRPAAA